MEEVWRGAQEIGERGVGRNVKAGSAGSCRGRGGPGGLPRAETSSSLLPAGIINAGGGVPQAQPHYGDFPLPVRPPSQSEPPQTLWGPPGSPRPRWRCGGTDLRRAGGSSIPRARIRLTSPWLRLHLGWPRHPRTLPDGHGAADPETPTPSWDMAPRMEGTGVGATSPLPAHHRHPQPREGQSHPSDPTRVTSKPLS